jgi:hypothetical protein
MQKNKYGDTLARLLTGNARLGLAFEPPPADKKWDVNIWRARQIPADEWKYTGCDFAMVIRRPDGRSDPGTGIRNHPIPAFVAYREVNKS